MLEAEGERAALEQLLRRLREDAPPLAHVERLQATALSPHRPGPGRPVFAITASPREARHASVPVATDTATCADCLRELHDPRRPPLSLSVRQLHELRPALHDRARRAV